MSNKKIDYKSISGIFILFIIIGFGWGILGNFIFDKQEKHIEKFEIRNSQPFIFVKNLKSSEQFYKKILGFSKTEEDEELIKLSRDSVEIYLCAKPDTLSIKGSTLYFSVSNLDSLLNKLPNNQIMFSELDKFRLKYRVGIFDLDSNLLILDQMIQ